MIECPQCGTANEDTVKNCQGWVLHPCGGKRKHQGKPMLRQGTVIPWSSAELPIISNPLL